VPKRRRGIAGDGAKPGADPRLSYAIRNILLALSSPLIVVMLQGSISLIANK
jgi:hypothetical protein